MASMVDFLVSGDNEIVAKISTTADRLQAEMIRSLNSVNTQLQRHIVSDKLSGQVLQSHTGNLKRSIFVTPAVAESGSVTGAVSLGSEAPYGLAHEYGAHIPERVPVNAKALHWIGKDGQSVFAMRARAFDLPERSFMRSSFAEFRERIVESMREAVRRTQA